MTQVEYKHVVEEEEKDTELHHLHFNYAINKR